jgi:hypothetical protein
VLIFSRASIDTAANDLSAIVGFHTAGQDLRLPHGRDGKKCKEPVNCPPNQCENYGKFAFA